MARQKKNRDVSIVHFSFFDLLFGAFGAFVFLMIMQVISTLNLVDIDLQNVIDESVREKQALRRKLENFQGIEARYDNLQARYEQARVERERLIAERRDIERRNQALDERLSRLSKEIDELDTLKSVLKEKDAARKKLEDRIDRLKEHSRQLTQREKMLEQELASQSRLPLEILTTSFPTTVTGEKIDLALAAVGGRQPYTWSLDGRLPRGFSFDPMQGRISGTADSPGEFTFNASVRDSGGEKTPAKAPIGLKIIAKPKKVDRQAVSPWFLVMTVISMLLLAYILWGKHKARQHYKKMVAEGWKLQWIK